MRRDEIRILDIERPPFLAALIAPHIVGTVLDLICGTGAVARAIENLTRTHVAKVERTGHDGGQIATTAVTSFVDFEQGHPKRAYDTVLLCTVLHHEFNPKELLAMAAQAARRRIIVVENCIDDACPAEYQELVDLIFNESLNKTALPCPGNHKTLADWLAMATQFGRARAAASVAAAPGIPLSHDVIVIEKAP